MSIKLSYYLGKNKIDLKKFCIQMNFKSFNEVNIYCVNNRIKCDMTQEDYECSFPKEKKVKKEEKIIEKPKVKARRRGRKPKAKTAGNSDSKDNS